MAKYAAKGAILAQATVAAPTVFTTIPGVKDFSVPLGTAEQIEVTSHDSTGGYKEYVAGLFDTGEISVPIVWDGANAQHAAIVANHAAGTVINYKVTGKESPTPKTYSFAGIVTGVEVSFPLSGAQEATVTIRPTGQVTFA